MKDLPQGFLAVLKTFQESLGNLNLSPIIKIPLIDSDSSDKEKRKAFKEVLSDLCDEKLSPDNRQIDEFVAFFENFYYSDDGKFRHMYSDVCEVMFSRLDTKNLDNGVPFSVVSLENNVTMLKEAAEKGYASQYAIDGLKKLQDHISLEAHRMRYMAAQNKYNKEIADSLSEEFEEKINSSLDNANTSFKVQIKETKDSLQKNYVTILGIFAAVVIAFMSASAFTSSVLESMNDVSIYRLSFTMLVLGFFIFNLLCALFMFLSKISNANAVQRWFVIAVDLVFVVLIVLTIIARFIHILG